jgi:peptide/nickel transport system substrate-binding protein
MLLIGIPVNLTVADWSSIFNVVIENKDFHLYVGKQDMYHSDVSTDSAAISFNGLYGLDTYGSCGANYVHFNNTQFDDLVHALRNASDNATAIAAAKEAQRVLAEQVGIIPLFARVGYKAHKNLWIDVANEEGNGVDNWWTFLMTHQENQPTGGTLTYGIMGDPNGLNPLITFSPAQQLILDLIYDSLLKVRDMSLRVPRIASDWTIDTWLNPDTGSTATKVIFHLNNDIFFHDGVQLTAADVKFSIEYMKTHKIGHNYAKVANVHHIDTPDAYTVVIYEKSISIWALQWLGSIPIIPKHRWQSIADPSAPMPEPTMTGTGIFKFVEYVPDDHMLLTANRSYLPGDVNHDGVVDAQDLTKLGDAYGSAPGTQYWNSSCDFNGDSKVDVLDLFTVGRNYGREPS